MASVLPSIGTWLGQIYNIVLPIGVTFGSLLVAVFGLPILVKMFKKLMG